MNDTRTITDLRLSGMSCASCAAHIENALNNLAGVHATVNFAVETAHVEHDPDVAPDDLVAAVESCGYHAEAVPEHDATGGGHDHMDHDSGSGLLARLVGSAALGIPVVAISMVMAWHFPGWEWLALVLTTPIVFWGGYPFHRAALRSARHGRSTMDTLVSLGTLAAYLWSVVVVLTGSGHHGGHVYFETAAAVTVFLLAGRYAEARAKRSAGAALTALVSLAAKDATVLRGEAEVRIPAGELVVGDVLVVRPGKGPCLYCATGFRATVSPAAGPHERRQAYQLADMNRLTAEPGLGLDITYLASIVAAHVIAVLDPTGSRAELVAHGGFTLLHGPSAPRAEYSDLFRRPMEVVHARVVRDTPCSVCGYLSPSEVRA